MLEKNGETQFYGQMCFKMAEIWLSACIECEIEFYFREMWVARVWGVCSKMSNG